MPEDMSPGEVGRTLERIEQNTAELRKGFDGWREIVIEVRHQVGENTKDIAAIQKDREAERQRADQERREAEAARKQDRRLIFAALVGPVIVLVIGFAIQITLNVAGIVP